ncbi:MAG: peptide deformylase [Proteobacteria bacterium]|uniref:Peptide deformylase n=1 Tax=Candidatus Enterousia excrementavium TaxID=2840789 RepID=A0A940IB74_9PROT|nr:peptide deformylase [Candidatus Enterousia excrementavium]
MLQMKLCGDLILREKCAPVTEITPEVLDIMDEMVGMMRDQNGVGLAAPQVGQLKRFLVMMDPDTETVFKMINPKIITRSADVCTMEEGCLSVLGPDDLPVYANVTRPASVDVEWTDENGKSLAAKMSGLPARIVQHETDHLDGVLFIDYLSPVRREMVMRKVRKHK